MGSRAVAGCEIRGRCTARRCEERRYEARRHQPDDDEQNYSAPIIGIDNPSGTKTRAAFTERRFEHTDRLGKGCGGGARGSSCTSWLEPRGELRALGDREASGAGGLFAEHDDDTEDRAGEHRHRPGASMLARAFRVPR